MNREEAIKIIDCYDIGFYDLSGAKIPADKLADAFDMAIEALSQPIVAKCYEIDNDRVYCSPEMADKIYRALHENTNVQNMHKGKWIKKQVFNPELDKYVPLIECSVCGYEQYYGGSEPKFNYCANCGADMRGKKE